MFNIFSNSKKVTYTAESPQCEYGCGHKFATEAERVKKMPEHTADKCWPRRKHLQPPLVLDQDPRDPPLGLAFRYINCHTHLTLFQI